MNNETILIIANGEGLPHQRMRDIAGGADIIIAADGGARHCREAGIKPHWIVGDMDSVPEELKNHFASVSLRHIADQDTTDMEKALQFAQTFSPRTIHVIAAFGLRTDHTLSNLLVFHQFPENIILKIHDAFGELSLLHPGQHHISGRKGQVVSLFAIQPVTGLTLEGFRYPVQNQNYASTFIGLSNVLENGHGLIKFNGGNLFIYLVEGGI